MEDFIKNIKAQLYDRVTSPLSFSFIVSWALWNYRYLIIIISSMEPDKKFSAIDSLSAAYTSNWVYWLQFGFVFPLVTTCLYIFVYPLPAKFVFRYVREKQRELKTIQTSIDDETPMSMEESRALKRHVREIVKEHEAEINDRDELIERLRQQPRASSPEGEPTETVVEVRPPEPPAIRLPVLTPSQLATLKKIAESSSGVTFSRLLPAPSGDLRVRAEYDLDKLVELGFIKRTFQAGEYIFNPTPKGRAYLIENS